MRKKMNWLIFSTIIISLFILIAKPIRTIKVMEKMAKNELMDEPFFLFTEKYDSLYKGIEGPIVTDSQDRIQFTWYKVLEWGDTATISAFVYKNFVKDLLGIFRTKNPPSVTADIKWYYVYVPEGISKFSVVMPNQYVDKAIDINNFKLSNRQQNIADSIIFIVNPERLLFFLKKGHFQVVEKQEEYTLVDFYQPIAKINHNCTNFNTSTRSAKIFCNDFQEVLIIPYEIPIEIKDRL